jgi:hypothetical protein
MWPCGLCVGVTTVVTLHRPLSAQSHSIIHSTFMPCNSTAQVGVTTVLTLHRPLPAQSHSVIHSTFMPCNSTAQVGVTTDHSQLSHALSFTVLSCPVTPAHVLLPVTVLQLTQIPPSSTDCLQIWQQWPTITNCPCGMSFTCNCSVYCTLPRGVCILLQINIHAFLRLIVCFY